MIKETGIYYKIKNKLIKEVLINHCLLWGKWYLIWLVSKKTSLFHIGLIW